MIRKLFFLVLVCMIYSEDYGINRLEVKVSSSSNQEIPNMFIIDIYCNNEDAIAGIQFELPDNFKLLEVKEARTKNMEFEFHHNMNGLILGFSMSGEKILAHYSEKKDRIHNWNSIYKFQISEQDQELWGRGALNYNPPICRLHVEYFDLENSDANIIECQIKTILASPEGKKIPFTNDTKSYDISFAGQTKKIRIDFYE